MTGTEAIVAGLERDHPRWQVWVVHRYTGGPVWCARLWLNERVVLNTGSPDELAEEIGLAELDQDEGGG